MFWQVICACEGRYHKINYKYERCKLTKTKTCCKNISCSFIYSFIFLIFSSYDELEYALFSKKFDQTKIFQILSYYQTYLIQQI